MSNARRRIVVGFSLVALAAVAVIAEPGARAEDAAAAKPRVGTWVYDVRVVRVDSTISTAVEAAPAWQPMGASGATTTATWADLLAGLKARGRTTILLDQKVTAVDRTATEFKQERRRPVLVLQDRVSSSAVGGDNERRSVSYVPSGANGQITPYPEGLEYRVDVSWEERPAADGMVSTGSASWRGSHSALTAGATLVLSHREQIGTAEASQGFEIYVLVTGWLVGAK